MLSRLTSQGVRGLRLAAVGSRSIVTADLPPAPIPPPPAVPATPVEELLTTVTGEPTLASIGLGGWSPSGMAQQALEIMHNAGLPWWGSIAVGTVCVRLLLAPVTIMSQRNTANMANNMPRFSYLQQRMSEARQIGNQLEIAKYSQEIAIFMKSKGINPLKNAALPFAQFPFFVSFFLGLRKMANYPVESMQYGGMLWFTDLTVPDQYYALPIITSTTLFATIHLGLQSNQMVTQKAKLMKHFFRAIPVIMLPFTINFPSAILCYWVCSNAMSLMQVGLLKLDSVRAFCKIPKIIQHPEKEAAKKKKVGMLRSVKDFWGDIQMSRKVQGRQRTDEMNFNKAGKGALVKTYKYDPTKLNVVRTKAS